MGSVFNKLTLFVKEIAFALSLSLLKICGIKRTIHLSDSFDFFRLATISSTGYFDRIGGLIYLRLY